MALSLQRLAGSRVITLRGGERFGSLEQLHAYTAKPESTEGGRRVSVLKRQEGAPVNLG